MNSKQLTREQWRDIQKSVEAHRDYLARLRDRMAEKAFPQDDPLRLSTLETLKATDQLLALIYSHTAFGDPRIAPSAPPRPTH